MVTVEQWHEIRVRFAQGQSQRTIARALGLSRNTVAAALAGDAPPCYSRAASQAAALTPFRESVAAGLRRGLAGVRLLDEVRAAGYAGSEATFYRWLATLKAEQRARPPCARFETDPGEQAQFDWSPYLLALGDERRQVFVFSLVFCYSRRVHFFPSLAANQEAVFEALEAGFGHFGGACRELVVDNAKVFILRHRGADLVWNRMFRRLCGHYAVQPIAGTPYHPQGKGKVENPFSSLERRLLQGGAWRDFDHLQSELATFEQAWEERIHGTTQAVPRERFATERPYLLPLPRAPFVPTLAPLRRVMTDGLVSIGGVRYHVPNTPVGQPIRVRTLQGRTLVVLSLAGDEIVRYPRLPRGTPPVFGPPPAIGARRPSDAALSTLMGRFRQRYASQAAVAERFLQELLAHTRSHPERALAQILALLEAVAEGIALATLAEAVELRLATPSGVEELLRRRLRAVSAEPRAHPSRPVPPITQLLLPDLEVERPLAHYARALPDESTPQP